MSARRSDTGAVLVEAALGLTFLAVLFLGVTEFGFAWRQTTVVEKTIQQSARSAANLADDPLADYEALQAFRALIASSRNITIDQIVVYRSTASDGAVPTACLSAAVVGTCNRYTAADLLRPASDFGCGGSKPDRFWCPTSRERDRAPSPDYVGLYAQLRYTGMTGMVPGTLTITRRAAYAVEPCAFGLPGC